MAETAARRRASEVSEKEKIFRGVSVSDGGAAALGRIYTPEGAAAKRSAEACILCLFSRRDVELAERGMFALSLSGAVLAADVISAELLNFLISSRLPYLIVREGLPCDVMGGVALLDAQRDILIIDPDIDTLNRYAEDNRISRACVGEHSAIVQSNGCGLSLKKERGGGVLVRGIEKISAAELFDALLDIAEELCGASVTVGVDARKSESFCERIEAIFRAAVYGNFSMQLENYCSEYDILRARNSLHSVFCGLEQEGREFNGYLGKGFLISAPAWLMQCPMLAKADFICFDFDRLSASLLGCAPEELQKNELPKREFFRAWECCFSHFLPSCELRAESGRLCEKPVFREWCALAGISKIYS